MRIRRLLLMGPDEILVSRHQARCLSFMFARRRHETFNGANEGGLFIGTERVPIVIINEHPTSNDCCRFVDDDEDDDLPFSSNPR